MSQQFKLRRVLIAVGLVIVVGLGALLASGFVPFGSRRPPQNALLVIAPYRYNGTWVFDDERFGLVREPFVGGVPEMIDVLVANIPDADKGFRLTFSAQAFPNYQKKLTWVRSDSVGNFYRIDDPPMEGWICPALFKYYQAPPKELFVRADGIEDRDR